MARLSRLLRPPLGAVAVAAPLALALALALAAATGCTERDPDPGQTPGPGDALHDGSDVSVSPWADGTGPGSDVARTPTDTAPETPPDAASDGAPATSDTTPPGDTAAEAGPAWDVTVQPDVGEPDVPTGTPKVDVDPPVKYTFSYVSPLPEPLTRQVNIMNVGGAPLTIEGIDFLDGGSQDFSMSLKPPLPKTIQPWKSTMVIVVFHEVEGGSATLRVTSNDPERETVDIAFDSYLKVTVAPDEPCGGIKPTALNFGAVERGLTKSLPAELSNCSETTPLVLKSVTRSNFFFMPLTEEFQIDPMPPVPTQIPPGGKLPITVSYSPKLAGPDSGHFKFNTDDPAEPSLKLDVAGIGTAPPPEKIGLTIKLSWDADSCDVDSHFLSPGGTFFDCDADCHFGNPSPDWSIKGDWLDDPFLDVDDVDGYGPEHINLSEPAAGTYKYVVHYYSDDYEASMSTSTQATVTVFSYGVEIAEFGPTFLDSTNWTWDVFTIDWPSAAITPLGSVYQVSSSAVGMCLPWPP